VENRGRCPIDQEELLESAEQAVKSKGHSLRVSDLWLDDPGKLSLLYIYTQLPKHSPLKASCHSAPGGINKY